MCICTALLCIHPLCICSMRSIYPLALFAHSMHSLCAHCSSCHRPSCCSCTIRAAFSEQVSEPSQLFASIPLALCFRSVPEFLQCRLHQGHVQHVRPAPGQSRCPLVFAHLHVVLYVCSCTCAHACAHACVRVCMCTCARQEDFVCHVVTSHVHIWCTRQVCTR